MTYKIPKQNKSLHSIIFFEETGCQLYIKNDELYVSGCKSQAEAEALIAAHNPPAPTEPTAQEKLASVGLSVDDLKVALGLEQSL